MLCTEVVHSDTSIGGRHSGIRQLLMTRRRELLGEIQSGIKNVREIGPDRHRATDLLESFEAEPEDDLVFAVLQMKTELLEKIRVAVHRVDAGSYGHCIKCGEAIEAARLTALPFAVRCRACEEIRESECQRAPAGLARRSVAVRVARYMR